MCKCTYLWDYIHDHIFRQNIFPDIKWLLIKSELFINKIYLFLPAMADTWWQAAGLGSSICGPWTPVASSGSSKCRPRSWPSSRSCFYRTSSSLGRTRWVNGGLVYWLIDGRDSVIGLCMGWLVECWLIEFVGWWIEWFMQISDLPLIPILSGYPEFSQKSRRHPNFPDLIPHIPIFGVRNCQREKWVNSIKQSVVNTMIIIARLSNREYDQCQSRLNTAHAIITRLLYCILHHP